MAYVILTLYVQKYLREIVRLSRMENNCLDSIFSGCIASLSLSFVFLVFFILNCCVSNENGDFGIGPGISCFLLFPCWYFLTGELSVFPVIRETAVDPKAHQNLCRNMFTFLPFGSSEDEAIFVLHTYFASLCCCIGVQSAQWIQLTNTLRCLFSLIQRIQSFNRFVEYIHTVVFILAEYLWAVKCWAACKV